MNTPTLSYIYNRKSAERIFEKDVKRVDIYTNAILVVFEKGQGSPRFVSKAVFKKHFAEYRKSSSRQVFVSYQPLYGYFRAPSSHNIQEAYRIELYPDHLECSCKDWEVQEQLGIAKPTCKHCYAVLDYIGCNSLADYVAKDAMEFLNHNQPYEQATDAMRDWHQEMMSCEN
jgi:hypothetical protein